MILLLLCAISLLVIGSIFSAVEVSIISVKEYRLRKLAQDKYWAQIGLRLKSNLQKVIIFSLFGNSFFNALLSTASTIIVTRMTHGNTLYISISTIIITIAIIIFSEAMPKILANNNPELVIKIFAVPSYYLLKTLNPVIWLIELLINSISQLFITSHTKILPLDELTDIINDQKQSIKNNYHKMLINSINTTKLTINEVVIPLRLVSAIDINDSYDKNINKLKNSYHTKIIVYQNSLENIIGYLHAKDILFNLGFEDMDLRPQIRPIHVAFEFLNIAEQIDKSIITKERIFWIIDQYGNSKGIAFLEDMLEIIYGEFTSTSPTLNFISEINNELIVDGAASISKLNNTYQLNLPTSHKYYTINGLLLHLLRDIPNNKICVRYQDLNLEIISVGQFWIERVKISRITTELANEIQKSSK